MSRFYRCKLEIESKTPISNDKTEEILEYFENFCDYEDHSSLIYTNGAHSMWFEGTRYLGGGMSVEEGHEEIVEALSEILSNCEIKTIWTYLEDLPTESYFTTI